MSGVAEFGQVMLVIVLSTAAFVAIGGLARVMWRMGSRTASAPPRTAHEDARLAGLEQAVDAIAIEVERISEAQRFTVALLSERLPDRVAARGLDTGDLARVRTPRPTDTPH